MSAEDGELPNALHRKSPLPESEQITINRLCFDLRIAKERVLPLIERGYLRIVQSEPEVIVARPAPEAMKWLRSMFQPLRLRPMIPTDQVALFLNVSPAMVRTICIDNNITFLDDPVFGELLSIVSFHRLNDALYRLRDPQRFDRQSLLSMLVKIRGIKVPRPLDRTSEVVELEIRRIAGLEEPERTLRAAELFTNYKNAEAVAVSLAKTHGGRTRSYVTDSLIERLRVLLEEHKSEAFINREWKRIKRHGFRTPRRGNSEASKTRLARFSKPSE